MKREATSGETARQAALREGTRLFNRGEWWEAHEAWEQVWMTSSGPERQFVQGLILLAAALHKRWHHGSLSGRNFHKAQAKLAALPEVYGGLNLRELQQEVARALETPGLYPQLPELVLADVVRPEERAVRKGAEFG